MRQTSDDPTTPVGSSSGPVARRHRRLADQPIRVKLALLLAAPLLALVALSGVIGYAGQSAASRAEQARHLVALGTASAGLAAQLQHERSAAALAFASGSTPDAIEAYRRRASDTDALQEQFTAELTQAHLPAGLNALAQRLRAQLAQLPLLREQVRSGSDATASVTTFRYRALIADLLGYRSAMSQLGVGAATADGLRAAATLSQAIESLGQLEISVLPALHSGDLTAAAQQRTVAADAGFAQAVDDFRQLAPPEWSALLSARTGGSSAQTGERLQALAVAGIPGQPLTLGVTAEQFVSAISSRMDRLHTVEHDLDTRLLAQVTGERDHERAQIAVLGAGVLGALLLAGALAFWMTRSLTRPIRALHAGATTLATTTLPDLVAKLTDWQSSPESADELIDQARPRLAVHGRDEIGSLAQAFNHVGAEASRLAGDQARLRLVVTQIVETLARRLQNVVGQVTVHLDRLEQDEQDPARMRLLFDLDETATGANRLVNNLLAIAGGRSGQPPGGAMPVSQVVKIAISWVEGAAPRVQDTDVTGSRLVAAGAVTDLAHLIAELLHNAVRYSRHEVTISAEAVGDRLYLQVSDRGIGVRPDRLPALQAAIDDFRMETAARRMGLPVVGLLARRHGIQVALRGHEDGSPGVCVDVVVPGTLLDRATPRLDGVTALRPAVRELPAAPPGDRPTALNGATLELPHRSWPVAGQPSPGIDRHEPPLVTYTQVGSHQRSLFDQAPGEAHDGGPADAWHTATQTAAHLDDRAERAAAAQQTGTATGEFTRSGLPKRVAQQWLVPQPAEHTAEVPRQRDPAAVQRGFAALGAAAQQYHP